MNRRPMKTISEKDLFDNVNGFLKQRGVELGEGIYTQRVQTCCRLLAEVVNTTQKTVSQAKNKVGATLDEILRKIHAKTAPAGAPKPKAARPRRTAPAAKKTKAKSEPKPRTGRKPSPRK